MPAGRDRLSGFAGWLSPLACPVCLLACGGGGGGGDERGRDGGGEAMWCFLEIWRGGDAWTGRGEAGAVAI